MPPFLDLLFLRFLSLLDKLVFDLTFVILTVEFTRDLLPIVRLLRVRATTDFEARSVLLEYLFILDTFEQADTDLVYFLVFYGTVLEAL